MDIFTSDQYFSSRVLQLARVSPLVKYSACAAAAKQMGQRSNPLPDAEVTFGQKCLARKLLAGGLDFLWYGAKYYERAIQMLAARIMDGDDVQDEGSSFPSPSQIYWAAASPQFSTGSGAGSERASDPRLVAACILTQYEHLSATLSAWAGHMNGFVKLLRLNHPEAASVSSHRRSGSAASHVVPQGIETIRPCFWYFVANDMEESCKQAGSHMDIFFG